MKRSVLMLLTAARWLGPARMPRVLTRAGFDVALLAPKESLAGKSRYIARIGYIADNASPMQWLESLIRMIDAVRPELLIPCDEMAVRLLFALALDAPPGMAPAQHARLVALITESLGDPKFYMASIDKTLLSGAATALGVRVPRYAIATGVDEAIAHASQFGFPVVLKRRFGFAGGGVEVVSTADQLVPAARNMLRPQQLDLGEQRAPQLLVQAFVEGPYHSQALVARSGVSLASFAWERFVPTTEVKGQTAVLRFVRSPETRAFAETLCRAFGIAGFINVQFVLDARTGKAHLLEINRRFVTHTHLGERVGRDLGRVLHDALEGNAPALPLEDHVAGGTVVVFPREWLRDPQSANLDDFPSDVPWDEPELFAAMLALRHEG